MHSKCAGYNYVRWIVAAVLLVAAALKTHGLWTAPTPTATIVASNIFQILLIEIEMGVAIALWMNRYALLAHWGAVGLFTVFSVFAFVQAVAGARSCACFGRLALHPWLAVLLDTGVLALLFLKKPAAIVRQEGRTNRWLAVCALGAYFAFPLGLLALAPDRPLGRRLSASVSNLELGLIRKAGRTEARFSLANRQREPVTISEVRTTCPCLKVDCARLVPAMDSVDALVKLDLGMEPDFLGDLAIDVNGFDEAGEAVFSLRVQAEIR